MKKDRSNTVRFLITGALMLVIFQVMTSFGSGGSNAKNEYVASAEAAAAIPAINVQSFSQRIATPDSHKMVFLYASWCPHCQRQKPEIAALAEHYGDKLDIILISVDKDIDALVNFLTKHPSDLTTYRIEPEEYIPFRKRLAALGSDFTGGIPHIILIGPDGKMLDEATGFVPGENLKAGLDKLLKTR